MWRAASQRELGVGGKLLGGLSCVTGSRVGAAGPSPVGLG